MLQTFRRYTISAVINNSLTVRAKELTLALVGGALFAVSSYDGFAPSAPFIATAGIIVLVWLANFARSRRLTLYAYGSSFYAVAFYWIPNTLQLFSGFPSFLCYLLFALFVLASALQFLLAGVFAEFIRTRTTQLTLWGLLFPLSWVGVDLFFPRMFPWEFAHPLISWSAFSGLAEFLGVVVLTFLQLWAVNLVVLLTWRAKIDNSWKVRFGALVVTLLPLLGGMFRTEEISDRLEKAASIKLAIIQPNFDAFAFMDRSEMPKHLETILGMSEEAVAQGAELLIWPESSINRGIFERLKTFSGTTLEYLGMVTVPYIAGSLTVREAGDRSPEQKKFNTGIVVGPAGEILGRYHKRILMPFGEYLPGAEIFPSLKNLSPQTGDFDVGDIEQPVHFKVSGKDISIGILICYEDIVSSLSRDYLMRGADLLVNITNDVWYSDSAALSEHNLLAAWRAIEVRSYLVRATNSGMSSVIDPIGRMIATAPIVTEQTIFAEVKPGKFSSPMFASTALALEYCLLISFWGCVLWCFLKGRIRNLWYGKKQ